MDKTMNTTVEILGKTYSIRCLESELKLLQQAAVMLSQKMAEVQNSGKAINLERIAIITALNITHQLLLQDQQKSTVVDKINQHIVLLQNKLDKVIHHTEQANLVYSD
ncbi:MAG: hypothetical protein A3F42_02160 [Gammaproteobacteria bacterium RIFCSPHIGHO2_12_FULL_37_34]|nr:MAG: hypothetical protein A3F42_02160 [Gammaproteobacteria bacterium RIFCSPHIGHO2_12_FULL_37_34]